MAAFSERFLVNRSWETLVPAHRPEEVTSINHAAESEAASGGLQTEDIDAIWRAVVNLYRTGLHPSIAICLRRRGAVLIDRAIGHVSGNAPDDSPATPKVPVSHATLFNHFSGSKAVTAMLVHLLDERRLVHLDDSVADYIPEFGKHGKESITLRHVLTHRAGLPGIPNQQLDLDMLDKPDVIMQLLCDAKPAWQAGRKLGYHAITGGYISAEIIRRVTGRRVDKFLQEEILTPLGFAHHNYGVRPDEISQVAVHAFTGPKTPKLLNKLFEKALGVQVEEAVRISNDPRFLLSPVPSGNIVSTANEAGRFYELLRNGGTLDGVQIFERKTIQHAVAEQTYMEQDLTLMLPMRYSMGFMLGSQVVSPYGYESAHAFGHLGLSNVLAWADPEREISVSIMTAGKPVITLWSLYWLEIVRQIASRCPKTGSPGV